MSDAPSCPACGTAMIADPELAAVLTPVPGWVCFQCVTIIDMTKLNLDQEGH